MSEYATDSRLPKLIEIDKASGKLQPSEAFPGYIEFVPSDDERKDIERMLGAEIPQTIKDYQPIWQDAMENADAYRHRKMALPDGKEILPSPLAQIAADQIIASLYNTILRTDPIISVNPYFPQIYDVMMPMELPGMDGGMTTATIPVKRDAEKVAMTWEMGYRYLLETRINFSERLRQVVTDIVKGEQPCWIKVCWNPRTQQTFEPTMTGPFIDLSEKREAYQQIGDGIEWHVLPVYNIIRPINEHDPQAARWIAERLPESPDDFLLSYYKGEYPLVIDDTEALKLSKQVTDTRTLDEQRRVTADAAMMKCDVWLVWFYRDVKMPLGGDAKRKIVKRLSLMGYYHAGANRLLSCFRNPYDHERRIYIPCFYLKDAHELNGTSAVGTIKWHQRTKSQTIGLELQNASAANNVSYKCDPDSQAWDYLQAHPEWRPNEVIPCKEGDFLEQFRKGAEHYSLLPLSQYVDNDAMRAVNLSDFETGQSIPGRTPAATVSQILQQGQQVPLMLLRTIGDAIAEAIKLDLRTRRQYAPNGEVFHVQDPTTKQMLEVLFQFPVEDAIDNFRFALTAADEALEREHDLPQLMGLLNATHERANFIASVTGPMSNPQMTPAQLELLTKILASEQVVWDRIISLSRTDVQAFDYTDQIQAIKQEREQAIAAAQQAAAQAAVQPMGAAPGGEGAQGGAGVPVPGGQPGAMGGPSQQPSPSVPPPIPAPPVSGASPMLQ